MFFGTPFLGVNNVGMSKSLVNNGKLLREDGEAYKAGEDVNLW